MNRFDLRQLAFVLAAAFFVTTGIGCAKPGVSSSTEVPQASLGAASETSNATDVEALREYFAKLEGEWILVRGETRELDPQGQEQGKTKVQSYGEAFFRNGGEWGFNGETCKLDQDGAEFCGEHSAGWGIRGRDLLLLIEGQSPLSVDVLSASPTAIEYEYTEDGVYHRRAERLLPGGNRLERSSMTYADGSRTVSVLETRKR